MASYRSDNHTGYGHHVRDRPRYIVLAEKSAMISPQRKAELKEYATYEEPITGRYVINSEMYLLLLEQEIQEIEQKRYDQFTKK